MGIIIKDRNDFYLDISRGLVGNHLDYGAYGINSDIDTGTLPEDIWSNGGVFVPPTTYRIHDVKSSDNTQDKAAGTGALTVKIYGVTANGLESETVTLNGTTNVPTVNAYSDIYIFYISTAGSGGTNVGTISATAQTDGTTTAIIPIGGYNTNRKAIRLIPPGYTGYLFNYYSDIFHKTANNTAFVEIRTKEPGGVWLTRNTLFPTNTGSSSTRYDWQIPLVLTTGTWVKMTCTDVSADNTIIGGGFNLILVRE